MNADVVKFANGARGQVLNRHDLPKGCLQATNSMKLVFFNSHATGSAHKSRRLICKKTGYLDVSLSLHEWRVPCDVEIIIGYDCNFNFLIKISTRAKETLACIKVGGAEPLFLL